LDFRAEQPLGWANDWYLVSPGDVFSEATRATYPAMFEDNRPGPPVEVGASDFYLGFHLPVSTAYGWVRLRPIGGAVTMVANAVAYSSRGIVVGTTQVVPEPTSAAVLPIALAALICKLRITRR
jgi:hypothetical protein